MHKLFLIVQLTRDTFLNLVILVIQNAFSTLKVINSNLLNVFPLTEFEKFWFLFLETRSKSKITLIKTKCAVIYYGNNNGNHMYFGKRKPLSLYGFSFMNIHNLQDSRGRGRLSLELLSNTFTWFTVSTRH